MSKYIRTINNVVVEVFNNATTLTIAELFHADLAVQFEPCNQEDVAVGWIKQPDGSFIAPPEPTQTTEPSA